MGLQLLRGESHECYREGKGQSIVNSEQGQLMRGLQSSCSRQACFVKDRNTAFLSLEHEG